jgi:hypothetical protein
MKPKPCLDPDARTPQAMAINEIGKNCLGADFSCGTCNLALLISTLRNQQEGMNLNAAYKDARTKQDYLLSRCQTKYDEREMHSSELTMNNKVKVR